MVLQKVGDLTPEALQGILQRSLASPSLRVTDDDNQEEGLCGPNDNFASDLRKIVVTVEENGQRRTLHLIVKGALDNAAAWSSVIFGLFIFYRETFWFDTAVPELQRLVSEEQAVALAEVVPRVHYAYCNYQQVRI